MSACLTEAELAALATAHHLTCESCRSKLLSPATHVTAPPSLEDTIEVRAPVDDVPASVGRYVVVEKNGVQELLGRGGYGKVLLTRDSAVGRDVALKCLRSRVVSSPKRAQAEARLLREARVVGQLEHPAIVPLYDVGRSETGQLFYTMRRIRGRTLAEAVASAGDFTARLRLLPHVLTACNAIAYAHSRGVIHRDLKPQNVMVDRFGQTAVIDWGLASTAGAEVDEPSAPETSNVLRLVGDGQTISDGKGRLGTPAYMSPEQLTGVRGLIDEKSDVWGLGAILFEVLTGRSPRANGPLARAPARPGWPAHPCRPKSTPEPSRGTANHRSAQAPASGSCSGLHRPRCRSPRSARCAIATASRRHTR
jgi:serine/threonine protein kinase